MAESRLDKWSWTKQAVLCWVLLAETRSSGHHSLSSLPFTAGTPGSSVSIPVARSQEVPRDRGVGIKALVKWPLGKPWLPSD